MMWRGAGRTAALMTICVLTIAAAAGAGTFNDRLRRLPPEQQRAVVRQAVTNGGQRCGRVTRAAFQQPYGNLMMWTATCAPGGDFGVYIGPDGSAQVRPCAEVASLKLPACRK